MYNISICWSMKNIGVRFVAHQGSIQKPLSDRVLSVVNSSLLFVPMKKVEQENERESILSGFYIPEEGSSEYEEWCKKLDIEIEAITVCNERFSRKADEPKKDKK